VILEMYTSWIICSSTCSGLLIKSTS